MANEKELAKASDAPPSGERVVVELITSYPGYASGERASFGVEMANELVKAGYAKLRPDLKAEGESSFKQKSIADLLGR